MNCPARLILAFSLLCLGCGSDKPAKLPTVPVSGVLLIDGKPFGPGILSLSPPSSDGSIPNATGNVQPDGKFTLNSYGEGSGVVEGAYSAYFAQDIMLMNKVPTTRPVEITIKKDAPEIKVELKSIKGAKSGMVPPTN